jgi:hypothetical protein
LEMELMSRELQRRDAAATFSVLALRLASAAQDDDGAGAFGTEGMDHLEDVAGAVAGALDDFAGAGKVPHVQELVPDQLAVNHKCDFHGRGHSFRHATALSAVFWRSSVVF